MMEIIQSRKDCVEIGRSSSYGNDLLGLLLNEMQKKRGSGFSLNLQLIMDECKTFFFAGHETTALLLTWTSMLLASNPTWQDKVRAQVAEVCNGETPSVDHLSKLTLVCNSSSFRFSLFPFLFLFLFFPFFISLASYQRAGCLATYIYIYAYKFYSLSVLAISVFLNFEKKHEPRLISPLDTVFLLYKNVPPLLKIFHLKNKRRAHTRPFISLVQLNMVINESMRLYPPATVLPRMAFEDIKLGDLHIPKGLSIWIPVLAIHHSEELWGKDANEFNPDRFAGKMFAPGRHFIPFAAGPRNCVGQSFAMMEAKIILAMLISRFSFTISQNYRHAPVIILTIKPKYGVQICLKPLKP